ncbi:glycosyltransferase family 15 protein [Dimargaris cristalligena]|uniref:Glycosyltransferase family 15 protein n=1 Tax=Dimargaris cristalligena TaxID=215637 RepID=A0A4P9ZUD3_9FUNG|nr:glycosyltransferase family 15 protein [Dimargaris cristalligena]|eukprot:RKP37155.1 glycosyltransferase family 15 protein [Dimargaris cristalligena]
MLTQYTNLPCFCGAQPNVTASDSTVTKVKGVFVVLVRNRELHELRWTLRQLEDRFNHKHNYPYVFLNDRPFTEEFKRTISWVTKAPVSFGQVPEEHWSLPDWIDRYKMLDGINDLIIYGASLSYRHMCRFNSGFFFRHPLLDGYEYYWRVEPDVQFTCDIDYDPFVYMKERDLTYGFTISLKEIPETVATLWSSTRKFMKQYPELIEQHNTLDWVSSDNGKSYNMCHFWSNFEIGKLDFFRSDRYLKYFDFLDQEGGFFYERWGDAPVHSLAVAMFLKKEEVHWFQDIGYVHSVAQNCPSDREMQKKCHCDPLKSVDLWRSSCTKQWNALPASP